MTPFKISTKKDIKVPGLVRVKKKMEFRTNYEHHETIKKEYCA